MGGGVQRVPALRSLSRQGESNGTESLEWLQRARTPCTPPPRLTPPSPSSYTGTSPLGRIEHHPPPSSYATGLHSLVGGGCLCLKSSGYHLWDTHQAGTAALWAPPSVQGLGPRAHKCLELAFLSSPSPCLLLPPSPISSPCCLLSLVWKKKQRWAQQVADPSFKSFGCFFFDVGAILGWAGSI